MVRYGDEEAGYRRVRERAPKEIDYSRPAKTPDEALESLMTTCAKAERCISDVERSLFRWRLDRADWPPIIDRLVRERFVDEGRYARAYVREKSSVGGWGRMKIVAGLRAKRIPAAVIEEALAEIEPDEQQEKLAEMLARRMERERSKARSGYELRMRMLRWAVGRGYDYETADRLLRQLGAEED